MTKAQRILELTDGTRTSTEIAKIVGCHDAYVRVVWRRGGTSEDAIDQRYHEKFKRLHGCSGEAWRYRNGSANKTGEQIRAEKSERNRRDGMRRRNAARKDTHDEHV